MLRNLDPYLSVWSLVERVRSTSNVLGHVETMRLFSHQIEDTTLLDGERTRLFAGFQVMSRFLPQLERYRRLAERAESIYVFAYPDVEPPPIQGITYVLLEHDDRLIREWFMVSYGAGYASALVTREESPLSGARSERQFSGLWTFEPELVAILVQWLNNIVEARPQPDVHDNSPIPTRQRKALERTIDRLGHYLRGKRSITIATEVQMIMERGLRAQLANLPTEA